MLSVRTKPIVGRIVIDVLAIDQGDQDVDVEQDAQGSSSRRAFTVSNVTGPPFWATRQQGDAVARRALMRRGS